MSCREAAPRATHLAGSPQKLTVAALPQLAGSLPPSLCEAPAAKDPRLGPHLLTWMPGQRPKKTTCRETEPVRSGVERSMRISWNAGTSGNKRFEQNRMNSMCKSTSLWAPKMCRRGFIWAVPQITNPHKSGLV
jgi:hypothetical protein